MPELKLGNKYDCYNCGTKFYDLGKSAALCPKCGADQKDAARADSPAVSQASRRKRKAEVAKVIDTEVDEPVDEIAEDEISETAELDAEIEEEEEESEDEA
jgi:uncharacterized protein (TIGR02300 family)